MTIRLQCIIIVVFYFHVRKLRNSFTDKEVHVMNKKGNTGDPASVYSGKLRHHPDLRVLRGSRKRKEGRIEKAFLSLPEEEAFKYFDISAIHSPAPWEKTWSPWNSP